jgi:hypothetical protein
MSLVSEECEFLDDEVISPDEVVEVPSFWTWKVDEVFWRPLEIDDRIRQVNFTLPSIGDCHKAQLYCDSRGKPVTKVGARIAREVHYIMDYYPCVEKVELRGETPCLTGRVTMELPLEVVEFMMGRDVHVDIPKMQENRKLKSRIVGFDEGELPELKYDVPVWREGY